MATLEIIKDLNQLDELYKESAYTVTGAGGDLQDWMKGLSEALEEFNIGTPDKFFTYKGKQMNEKYQLEGKVAYPDDLTFLSFPLTNLDVSKLAIFKLRAQDRWFDDIVDNNKRHMEELYG